MENSRREVLELRYVSRMYDFSFPTYANLSETRPSGLLLCKLRNLSSEGSVVFNSYVLGLLISPAMKENRGGYFSFLKDIYLSPHLGDLSLHPQTAHACHLENFTDCGKLVIHSDLSMGSEVTALHQTSKFRFVGTTSEVDCSFTCHLGHILFAALRVGLSLWSLKSCLVLRESDKDERQYQGLVSSNTALEK